MMRILIGSLLAVVFVSLNSHAQEGTQTASAPAADPAKFSQEELDQMLASIALYPDSLLSQILMASTYPLEIVEADRWTQANAELTGDALTAALEAEDWDPSVKSLCNFPDILKSLSDNLDWTTKIGDAFIADQKAVMDTVQNLRAKAKEAGNLETTDEMAVITEPAPAGSTNTEVIVIESSDPEVVYVPSYDSTVVYGSWWYPSYPPPTYYYPPGWVAGSMISFGAGLAIGAAWGYAWGDCDWGGGDVDIDIDRNTNINTNIDRSKAKAEFEQRGGRDGQGSFNHDPSHRKGVEYRDKASADKFGGTSRADAVQARDSYRGKADAGRADLARDTASGRIDTSNLQRPGPSDRAGAGASAGQLDRSTGASRPSTADRAGATTRPSTTDRSTAGSRTSSSYDRSSVSRSSSSSAFSGSSGGSSVSRDSARGSYSRSSGASRSGGASRGGGARGGGGRR